MPAHWTRWNKFMPIEGRDADDTVVVESSTTQGFPVGVATIGPTTLLQQLRDNFNAFIVPFGVASAFFGPASETVRRRVRTYSATAAPFVVFAEALDEQWVFHAELLRAEDVRELERLWALPYPGPAENDFRVID
ncbi:MAG TPA: hypothetical protein VNI55_14710 [Gaiellaceae bacterium]|nr:hypothetical protein [Gaiellaceae bacterium]